MPELQNVCQKRRRLKHPTGVDKRIAKRLFTRPLPITTRPAATPALPNQMSSWCVCTRDVSRLLLALGLSALGAASCRPSAPPEATPRAVPSADTGESRRVREATFCYNAKGCTVKFLDATRAQEFVCGTVLLRLRPGSRRDDIADLLHASAAQVVRDWSRQIPWLQVAVRVGTERDVLLMALAHRHVQMAQLELIREPDLRTP